MSQASVLYDLQQIDNEIGEKRQRLGEVLRAQKGNSELTAAQQQTEADDQAVKTLQAKQRELNLELGSLNDKANRSEQRLYSGSVTNPKELSDLQHEIESLGRRRETLEGEILETMIALEEAQGALETSSARFAKLSDEWETTVASLQEEQQVLALRLHQLTGRREQQAALADKALLRRYEQMVPRKGGVAVAGLQRNKCLGCGLTVPEHTVRDANQGKLVQCDSCDRFLFPL